jgi:hypothetical protein
MQINIPYKDIKDRIRPFDIFFFKGSNKLSQMFSLLEKVRLGESKAIFTHMGIVVTSNILKGYNLKPGELYLWESSVGGILGDGVTDVNGSSYFGVQVRSLDKVVENYHNKPNTKVAWAHLKNNPLDSNNFDDLLVQFQEIFTRYNGRFYDFNVFSLLAAVFPLFRCLRNKLEEKLQTKDWLFSSEFCFSVYQDLGLFDKKFDPKDVLPVDFLEEVDEDGTPCIIENYMEIKP